MTSEDKKKLILTKITKKIKRTIQELHLSVLQLLLLLPFFSSSSSGYYLILIFAAFTLHLTTNLQ